MREWKEYQNSQQAACADGMTSVTIDGGQNLNSEQSTRKQEVKEETVDDMVHKLRGKQPNGNRGLKIPNGIIGTDFISRAFASEFSTCDTKTRPVQDAPGISAQEDVTWLAAFETEISTREDEYAKKRYAKFASRRSSVGDIESGKAAAPAAQCDPTKEERKQFSQEMKSFQSFKLSKKRSMLNQGLSIVAAEVKPSGASKVAPKLTVEDVHAIRKTRQATPAVCTCETPLKLFCVCGLDL